MRDPTHSNERLLYEHVIVIYWTSAYKNEKRIKIRRWRFDQNRIIGVVSFTLLNIFRVNKGQKYSESLRVRQYLESVRVKEIKIDVHSKISHACKASAYWARTDPLTVPDRTNQDHPSRGLQYIFR